jgi:hypothetical protein
LPGGEGNRRQRLFEHWRQVLADEGDLVDVAVIGEREDYAVRARCGEGA